MDGDGSMPKVLGSHVLFEAKKIRLVEDELEFPDGHRESWVYTELKGNGGVRVLALTEKGELVFVYEYRGAARKKVLRIPSGSIGENESAEEAARRELEEEAGFYAKEIEFAEELEPTSSYFKSASSLFLARGLRHTKTRRDPGERDMELVLIPLRKAYAMVANLEIRDLSTIHAILWLKKHLREASRSEKEKRDR